MGRGAGYVWDRKVCWQLERGLNRLVVTVRRVGRGGGLPVTLRQCLKEGAPGVVIGTPASAAGDAALGVMGGRFAEVTVPIGALGGAIAGAVDGCVGGCIHGVIF